ncbi:MAG: NACHT domain-containing protein, partial [Planctomycetota bacterium]
MFLSTVTREFGDARAELAQFCQRTKRVHVRHQDDFCNSGKTTLLMLADEVQKSDFVVHVIGDQPGWAPPIDQVRAFLDKYPGFAEQFPQIVAVAENAAHADDAEPITATQWEAWLALFFAKEIDLYSLFTGTVSPGQQQHISRVAALERHPKPTRDEKELFREVLLSLIDRGIFSEAEIADVLPNHAPSRLLRHAPEKLFGRDAYLDALDAAWEDHANINVYSLIAWGGVGKTALVAHWMQRLRQRGWPGVERYFDWSFYSQGTGESRQTSSDLFISAALQFFGDPDPTVGNPWDRGQRLAGLVARHRTLLILDGIEPLQYPPTDRSGQAGMLKDQALQALLAGLVQHNPGLCVITSRETLTDLRMYHEAAAPEHKVERLLRDAAISMLRHLQVVGTDEELTAAWEELKGHALSLQLLGRYLVDAFPDRDIRHRPEITYDEADKERQGRSAFKVMAAYERWLAGGDDERQRELAILRLTGLFDRPINEDCLRALRSEPAIENLTDNIIGLTDRQWNAAVRRLEQIELISNVGQLSARDTEAEHENPHQTVGATEPQSLDAHPLIREYFAEQLRREQVDAFRAGHSRLFDHLCESTPHRPDGIEGLQPLYQAVVHGCLAERQQEVCDNVYIDRILRGGGSDGFYSTKMLGAIGADLSAAAAFFDQPWTNLSPNLSEPAQAWLLNDAAYHLRALGRLTEAVQPMRAGLEQRIKQEVWKSASVIASNLSQLELTLGRVSSSVESARRSVEYADRSKNTFQRMSKRTAAADALHHFGEFDEAAELFAAAESLQKEQQPQYPLLYSLQGFLYCDLLLENAERSAWRAIISGKVSAAVPLTGSTSQSEASGQVRRDSETAISECEEVERRANKMFEWRVPDDPVLDIALDHLTLARVELYRALLNAQPAEENCLVTILPPQ